MYQIIGVDDWSQIELSEVLQAIPTGSMILLGDKSLDAFEVEADEPPTDRKS